MGIVPHSETGIAAQGLGRVQHPERVVQRLAADGDQIGVAGAQDLLGPITGQARSGP